MTDTTFTPPFHHDPMFGAIYDAHDNVVCMVTKSAAPFVVDRLNAYKTNGMDTAWPLPDVLKKLIEAADILLHQKDYDGHGWEEIENAYRIAQGMANAYKGEPQSKKEVHEKSLRLLQEYLNKTPDEEIQKAIDKVEALGFEGPTFAEYLNSLGGEPQQSGVLFASLINQIDALLKLPMVYISDIPETLQFDFQQWIVGQTLSSDEKGAFMSDRTFWDYYKKLYYVGWKVKDKIDAEIDAFKARISGQQSGGSEVISIEEALRPFQDKIDKEQAEKDRYAHGSSDECQYSWHIADDCLKLWEEALTMARKAVALYYPHPTDKTAQPLSGGQTVAELQQQVKSLREVLEIIPPNRLRMLAQWIDGLDTIKGIPASEKEIQKDLLLMAFKAEEALKTSDKVLTEDKKD